MKLVAIILKHFFSDAAWTKTEDLFSNEGTNILSNLMNKRRRQCIVDADAEDEDYIQPIMKKKVMIPLPIMKSKKKFNPSMNLSV